MYVYIHTHLYIYVCKHSHTSIYVSMYTKTHTSIYICPYVCVEKRKISYFGLALNLFQDLISPNQDDLSYSARTFISGLQNGWATKPTLFGLRRRPEQTSVWSSLLHPVWTSHCGFNTSSSNMDTQRGNHLIYGFLTRNPSWIWIGCIQHTFHRHYFMSPQKMAMSIRA